jgi:hypothetical protein
MSWLKTLSQSPMRDRFDADRPQSPFCAKRCAAGMPRVEVSITSRVAAKAFVACDPAREDRTRRSPASCDPARRDQTACPRRHPARAPRAPPRRPRRSSASRRSSRAGAAEHALLGWLSSTIKTRACSRSAGGFSAARAPIAAAIGSKWAANQTRRSGALGALDAGLSAHQSRRGGAQSTDLGRCHRNSGSSTRRSARTAGTRSRCARRGSRRRYRARRNESRSRGASEPRPEVRSILRRVS